MPQAARILADVTNPLLALLWVVALVASHRRPGILLWVLASAAGLAMAVMLAEYGKHHHVWPHHPSFPSGHETFGTSVATSLVWRDPRWLPVALLAAATLAWALVAARYHTGVDVAGAAVLGPVVTSIPHVLLRPDKASAAPS